MNTILDPVILPDGAAFPFWDDQTEYRKVYHVACLHPRASDEGPGSAEQPFKTINRAAQALQPGEKVIVHGGVYRECVRPARGGLGPQQMIAYEAAAGEEVLLLGSEQLSGPFEPGEGWNYGYSQQQSRIWSARIPVDWVAGYNPFMIYNMITEYTTFTPNWTPGETNLLLLRRGRLFCDGQPLTQVLKSAQLGQQAGTYWVEDPGLRVHFRLPDDRDPHGAVLEAAVREQAFAPLQAGLGYIRVSGFQVGQVADGFPIPQRAAISTGRGHHWIIEDCDVRHINGVGIDLGNESWHRRLPVDPFGPGGMRERRERLDNHPDMGRHIVRRCHISDCGVCGIAGVGGVSYSLIEDNTIERVATVDIERLWETGGIKLHTCTGVLIRRNLLRHIRSAPAVWLDFLIQNSRITGNVVHDVASLHGGIMIEVSHEPNLVDHNVLWDVRGVEDIWHSAAGVTGPAIVIDTGESSIVAHNFIANVPNEYAISINLAQPERVVVDRFMLCRKHRVANNVLVGCPRRILLAKAEDNRCDGNLYDPRDDAVSLCIEFPAPKARMNLESWRGNYGYDVHGGQARIDASFDPETLTLTLDIEGQIPPAVEVEGLAHAPSTPGPWDLRPGRQEIHLKAGRRWSSAQPGRYHKSQGCQSALNLL